MVWRSWHGLWYGLADMTWYMVCSYEHGIVYGMTRWASHGICIGLARCGRVYVSVWWGMAWYMVWPVGHYIVHRMAWRVWHGIWYSIVCMAWHMVWPGEFWGGI